MLCRSAFWRCVSNSVGDDRKALARNHLHLLDKRQWDLTTPSRALPVVEVLLRSGVVLDGLEKSAAKPLWSMTPSMTKKERSLVQKLSGMLHTNTASLAAASSSDQKSENGVVRSAYAAACSTGKCTIGAVVDHNFVRCLQLPFQLMLLELILSRYISVVWVYKAPMVTKELLDPLCDQLLLHEDLMTFKTVWWLLVLLSGDARLYNATVAPAAGKRLYGLCVRRIHQLLPHLWTEQRLLVHLVLTSMKGYERPFIVIGEIEKLALVTPLSEYEEVNSKVLLQFMSSPFATKQINLTLRLVLQWCKGTRIADFGCEECLLAFSIVASLHECTLTDTAFAAATAKEWEVLHECLFAQVFLVAGDMTPTGCISILDQAELINVSGWGITVPQLLLEKLKRRLLTECKRQIDEEDLSPETAEDLLRVVLGLQHLLQRYTVLPYSAPDERIINQYVLFLEQRLAT
ncbi:hypothetical protein ABB37_05541 [Leptomonas pyrrhocoris]|uniref:Uncharacterized protein n=1 Tax=Leptomonas pyrrhocoris TaxID=157538 RepID=A0A0M9FZ02_LEPPY|nr:hypothetical protein ABB37_05541 [Leptomonas pyrrhocoris]KPA78995.1 hypothetical protein ABB37_05541 [Leptomonas pyrrhocoris]|eukprot:XP_015657434.1 hypothetical protein ABB37_05541 [Leptomonas pyrrhocoris]